MGLHWPEVHQQQGENVPGRLAGEQTWPTQELNQVHRIILSYPELLRVCSSLLSSFLRMGIMELLHHLLAWSKPSSQLTLHACTPAPFMLSLHLHPKASSLSCCMASLLHLLHAA